MNEFTATLAAFLAGRRELADVEAAARTARTDPAVSAQALDEIERLYRTGRLPPQVSAALKRAFAGDGVEDRGTAAPAPDDDRTRLHPRRRSAAVPPSSLHAGDPTPTNASIAEPSTSDPSTGDSSTGDPSSGDSSTGEPSTGGGGSWSDPSSWGATPAGDIGPGSVLKGRFVLEQVVGRGGMGVVYRARDLRKEEAQDRDPIVAIKVLNDDFRRHPESLKALQREARKAQTLAHPNIATVFDFDRDGPIVYIQMEFLDGESLDKLLKTSHANGLPYAAAYRLISGLGRALSYAHGKGIVHSDFKPGNCFLTRNDVVKVFDFGIARAAQLPDAPGGELTRFDPGTLGALTPAYASCEMIDGAAPDPRDDIYALGCVAYELLTGKHPFGKRSAAEARAAGMAPTPVKGLSPKQWRALRKALAFRRAERSASVAQFLEELGERKRNKAVVASSAAAAAALAVSGVALLPGYLQGRQIQTVVADFSSGANARITAAIARYRTLDPTAQNTVLQSAREPLLDYYRALIASAVDPDRGRYDYPAAASALAAAQSLIPDSATLSELAAALAADKADLLLRMRTQFDEHLAAGRLRPAEGPDVVDVLDIVAQADPGNALLRDPQLVLAYTRSAAEALARADLTAAGELIDLGLLRDPDDGGLRDLRDTLAGELEARAAAERVTVLHAALADAPDAASLDELRELDEAAEELAALVAVAGASDAVLDAYRARYAELLEPRLAADLAALDWAAAERVLAEAAGALSALELRGARLRIAAARNAHEQQRDALLAELHAASDADAFDRAIDRLSALEQLPADPRTVRRARSAVERGYVRAARGARAAAQLDTAEQLITAGLAFEPESALLRTERDALDAARAGTPVDAAAAERYRASLTAVLAQPSIDVEAAADALADVDRLAVLAPEDPLVTTGRNAIAEHLGAAAAMLVTGERFDAAVAMLEGALDLIAESATLRDTRSDVLRAQADYLASRGEDPLASARQALQALLAAPRFDGDWESETRALLADLERAAPAGDTTVPEARSRIAALYVARAAEMRTAERLGEADRLLGVAAGYAPELDALAAERMALAEMRRAAAAANAERERAARLEGMRQTFLAAANANDPARARSTLEALTAELPAADPFLTRDAPRALGGMLLRLARAALGAERFDEAERLASEGLEAMPADAELTELLSKVRTARADAERPAGPPCTASLAGFGNRGARGQCWDMLDAETQGPRLVVVPAGGTIAASFAIGRFEIALAQWNAYCRASAECTPRDGEETMPLTNITVDDARRYTAWLGARTGETYRLPTAAEWEHAASAPRDGRNDDNCVVAAAGRGGAPRNVTQGQQNDWGLMNYQGNVQEWVETGDAVRARGGTYQDPLDTCTYRLEHRHSGAADAVTGFRVVREL